MVVPNNLNQIYLFIIIILQFFVRYAPLYHIIFQYFTLDNYKKKIIEKKSILSEHRLHHSIF